MASTWEVRLLPGPTAPAVRALLHVAPAAAAHMDATSRTPLAQACANGHRACAEALLRAAPDAVLTADDDGFTPVHMAAYGGHAGVLSLLLASRRFPSLATLPSTDGGWTAAHLAAQAGHQSALEAVVAAAGAQALVVPSNSGFLPLHSACEFGTAGQLAAVIYLLRCASEAAERRCHDGQLLIELALAHHQIDAARCLLPYPPSQTVLGALRSAGGAALPLFGDFVRAPGRLPLSLLDWSSVPQPCPSLQHVLPAALAHSTSQAALLVHRLPPLLQQRLRTLALVLARVQRRLGLQLPALLVQRLLSFTFEA